MLYLWNVPATSTLWRPPCVDEVVEGPTDRPTDSAAAAAANRYFWSIVSREKLQPLSVSVLAERPIPRSVVRGFGSAETSMCCALV